MGFVVISICLKSFNKLTKLLAAILLGLSINGYAQQYDLREYSSELGQPYIYTLNQDNNGYLWIGTGNGLTRFNGFDFKTFTIHDSLANNFISRSLKNGNDLWFGHINGDITFFNGEEFTPFRLNQQSGITDIEKSPNGSIWVATFANSLIKIDAISKKHESFGAKNSIAIYALKFITDKQILIGSNDGLKLCKLNDSGEIEIIQNFNEIPHFKVSDIIKMRNNSGYYVATENNGLYQISTVGDKFQIKKIASELDVYMEGVQSIFEDSNSNIWLSTFGNGLVKITASASFNFSQPYFFNKTTGFLTNNVKTAFQDREGNIWSGNYGTGLTQLTIKAFSYFSFDKNLYGSAVYSIYSNNKFIWLGTNKGLLVLDFITGDLLKFYSTPQGLPVDKITALYSFSGYELWIGTENNGVFLLETESEKIIPFEIGNGLLENSITAITGKTGRVWIGTKKGLCCVNFDSQTNKWYTLEKGGLPHNFINSVFLDSKNRLWILTPSNILTYIKDGKVEKIPISSDKGAFTLGNITEDNDSNMWVGSSGGGIFRVKEDSIANITRKEGLLSDYSYSILADNTNHLWVGHRGGLSKIRTNDLFVKQLQRYAGIGSGVEFSKNAIHMDGNDRILFGSNEGLWLYDPQFYPKLQLPPVLNITSIIINDEEYKYNENIILPPGNYKIKIEFLGINLTEPLNVRYQYQLEGFDPSTETTKLQYATYPRLSSGNYTFVLKALTSDGIITEVPLKINILIKKSIWMQWWFYLIDFILLAIIVIIFIKRREIKSLDEKYKLELMVQERTLELARKNEMLYASQKKIGDQNNELKKYKDYLEKLVDERTHELLKAKNKAEESDRLKTAFLQNMSHEIRTPMNGILGFLGLLQESGLDVETQNNYIEIINKSGQRLLTTINDIIEISKLESTHIPVKNDRVNIMEVMNFHLNFFKHQAKEKGITLKLVTQVSENDAIVEMDNKILNGILTNLIKNAIKFTFKGSVEFGNYIDENSIVFYVKDTGIGIPPDRHAAIFDRFVKADLNDTRPYEGSGLGLSIVKAYVEKLNGKIWVNSEIEKGTMFFVSLPYKPINYLILWFSIVAF